MNKLLMLLVLLLFCGDLHAEFIFDKDALEPTPLSQSTIEEINKGNKNSNAIVPPEIWPILPAEGGYATSSVPGKSQNWNFQKNNLINRSKSSLVELVNHEVLTNTYVVKASGKLSYLGSNLAARGQRILFQQDYVSYKVIAVEGKKKKLGVLLRLEAELVTKAADLKLNGLFAIGAAASSGTVSGKLRFKVYGLSGRPISMVIPSPSDISEQSLLDSFTAIATIKSKIYDDDVYVIPQEISSLPFEFGI